MKPGNSITVRSLVLFPALITLAVTLTRLTFELFGAPAWLSNDGMGGRLAVVGIAWLPFIMGPWFDRRLRAAAAAGAPSQPSLLKTLLVYGFWARLPVFLLTIPAVFFDWGTHYEKFPPPIADASSGAKIGVAALAQFGFWGCFWTVGAGMIAAKITRSRA